MKKVGLTGGIGSGKTTVAKMFETLGIPVYYADTSAKQLMRSDRALKNEIKKLLGPDAYYRNGYPHRAYIAKKIFGDKKLLSKLNNIVHPAVKKDLQQWFSSMDQHPFCIYESAIIIDHHTEDEFDLIISVIAPQKLRIERLLQRDRSNEEAIQRRMANQISDEERIAKSDYIIHNGIDYMLIPQVYDIFRKIIGEP